MLCFQAIFHRWVEETEIFEYMKFQYKIANEAGHLEPGLIILRISSDVGQPIDQKKKLNFQQSMLASFTAMI